AKILSPHKTVLIPDLDAGCSLASSITAEDVRRWKDEYPGAVVVAYVNTTAEVKAESDICCTSSNAVDVVRSIPEDREVLFLPDMFLGAPRTGILHQLRKGNPAATFEAVNEYAVCQYMKRITPPKLLRSLREGVFEVTVPEDVRVRAARAVQRMVEIVPAVPVAVAVG